MPNLTANDEEIILAGWRKNNGEFVNEKEVICDIESTKAVSEVESEYEGYLYHIVNEGDYVLVNNPIFLIAEKEIENIDEFIEEILSDKDKTKKITKRWTKKAEITAKRNNLDIASVPSESDIIQEMDVIKFIEGNKLIDDSVNDIVYDLYGKNDERIIIIGGGKAAITVADIILQNANQKIIGVLDDNPDFHKKNIFGYEIFGSVDMIYQLWEEEIFDTAIISFSGNINARKKLFEEISSTGIPFTNAIDKSVQIHKNVKLGTGNIIFGQCRIGACATIGDNNVVSAFSNIEHHNNMGSHCTFGPGVICSGTVNVGNKVKFGTGIFIEPRLKIGDNVIISSGSIITVDVPKDSIVKKVIDIKMQ